MQTVDPPLINHAAQMAAEEALVALVLHHKSPATLDRDIDAGGQAVPEPHRSPVAPAVNPGETALATTERTLAYLDAQTGKSASDCVNRFARVLASRHGVSHDAALALALAALSAAAGPGRTLRSPLGGAVSTALNVIVEDAINARVRRAARQAVQPLQQTVDGKILAHQVNGDKHLRLARMELETECARAIHRLRSPPTRPPEPITIPLPAEERAKEALATAVHEAEPVAEAMQLHEFERRPFVITDGLTLREIADLRRRSFDGAVFNYSLGGDALRQLEAMRAPQRQDVLRFMVAAWHGESFPAGSDTIVAPTLTSLWLCDLGDTMRLGRNRAVAGSGWLETVLMVTNDALMDVANDGCPATEVDDDWRKLVGVVLGERIMGTACEHRLSEAATMRFLEFHADTVRRQVPSTQKFTAWWSEQVLKIALLLHLDTPYSEVPKEISLATMKNAVSVTERLGNAQLRVVQSISPQDDFDAEIELMVAKVRLHGPLRKRDLYRKYNVQDYRHLDPILALCREREKLKLEGDLIYPALPG